MLIQMTPKVLHLMQTSQCRDSIMKVATDCTTSSSAAKSGKSGSSRKSFYYRASLTLQRAIASAADGGKHEHKISEASKVTIYIMGRIEKYIDYIRVKHPNGEGITTELETEQLFNLDAMNPATPTIMTDQTTQETKMDAIEELLWRLKAKKYIHGVQDLVLNRKKTYTEIKILYSKLPFTCVESSSKQENERDNNIAHIVPLFSSVTC